MKGPAGVRRFILHPSAFILFLSLAGCTRYEYDVVQPPELAGHVGTQSWLALRRDPLEYYLRTSDNRLVMRIYNRGEAQVKLLGADSAAVDPRGESHPLVSATIPPGSYVTRIFPPPRPTMQRTGPSVGFGVGAGYAGASHGHPYHHHHYPYHYYASDLEPRYYTVYDPNDRTYFDWPGETSMRFLFAFQREGAEPIRHEFLIRKRKM